jgi:hypothetical protein
VCSILTQPHNNSDPNVVSLNKKGHQLADLVPVEHERQLSPQLFDQWQSLYVLRVVSVRGVRKYRDGQEDRGWSCALDPTMWVVHLTDPPSEIVNLLIAVTAARSQIHVFNAIIIPSILLSDDGNRTTNNKCLVYFPWCSDIDSHEA